MHDLNIAMVEFMNVLLHAQVQNSDTIGADASARGSTSGGDRILLPITPHNRFNRQRFHEKTCLERRPNVIFSRW